MGRIVKLESHEQAIKLTKHCGWCTGKPGNQYYWHDYSKKGNLYIYYKDGNRRPSFQIFIHASGHTFELKDKQNIPVQFSTIEPYPDLVEFLQEKIHTTDIKELFRPLSPAISDRINRYYRDNAYRGYSPDYDSYRLQEIPSPSEDDPYLTQYHIYRREWAELAYRYRSIADVSRGNIPDFLPFVVDYQVDRSIVTYHLNTGEKIQYRLHINTQENFYNFATEVTVNIEYGFQQILQFRLSMQAVESLSYLAAHYAREQVSRGPERLIRKAMIYFHTQVLNQIRPRYTTAQHDHCLPPVY